MIKKYSNEKIVKDSLDLVLDYMEEHKDMFVKNPEKDFTRNRKLSFRDVIKLVLSMKGNTLNKELYDYFGQDAEKIVKANAFVQQRDKIREDAFEFLFGMFNDTMVNAKTYKGYRLLAVDGSDINVAYNKDADTYVPSGRSKVSGVDGKGYNQVHLNAVYDLLNKVYTNAILQSKSKFNERRAFLEMVKNTEHTERTLYICDRGYPSWNIFANFKYIQNADFLIRYPNNGSYVTAGLPQTTLDVMRSITVTTNTHYASTKKSESGNYYAFIKVKKNKLKNKSYSGSSDFVDWDFGEYEKLNLRIVRFEISDGVYETIITSLPKDRFPLSEIKKLYAMRWGIETSFRELKYIIGLSQLHCRREDFVREEIFARLTMYNFCERILSCVVIEQDENRKYQYQVNFTMGMQICLDMFRSIISVENMYELICKYILPIRPDRADKRKMRHKTFVGFIYRVA